MLKTYTEQLEEVQAAISEILTRGQSVSANDSAKQRAQLDALERREQRLIPLAAREASGRRGPVLRQAVPGG